MARNEQHLKQELYVTKEEVLTAIGWCLHVTAPKAKDTKPLVKHLCDQVDAKKVRREALNRTVSDVEILHYLAADARVDRHYELVARRNNLLDIPKLPDRTRDVLLAARENAIILKRTQLTDTQVATMRKNSEEMTAAENLCSAVRREQYRRKNTPKISILPENN